MKPTAMSSKCFSGARGLSHAGIERGARSAHTPQRRQRGYVLLAVAGQPRMYVEAVPAPHGSGADRPASTSGLRRVLHVDMDCAGAAVLASLLTPEADVIHAATLAEACRMLEENVFSLVVLDPALPDGDASALLPLLSGTPLLVYAAHQPEWRDASAMFLPKPWTSPRQLWVAVAGLLGLPASVAAGDCA